jgi:predicted alpha/beta hydrolase family esterase
MMRERVLIMHGWGNRRWPGHWQRRLATALRESGHVVGYPQMPSTDEPVLADWMDVVAVELELLHEVRGGDVVVVAHSLGCLTWLHAAAAGRVAGVKRVLLVAPADPDLCGDAPTFQLNVGQASAALRTAADSTVIVASEADPWLPRGAAATFAKPLDLPLVTIAGAQHFAIDDGWGPWQGVIDWVRDPDADLAVR